MFLQVNKQEAANQYGISLYLPETTGLQFHLGLRILEPDRNVYHVNFLARPLVQMNSPSNRCEECSALPTMLCLLLNSTGDFLTVAADWNAFTLILLLNSRLNLQSSCVERQ